MGDYIVYWPRGWNNRYKVDGVLVIAQSHCAAAEYFAKEIATQYQDCGHLFDDDCGEDLIVVAHKLPACRWGVNVSNLDTLTNIRTTF